DSLTHWRSLIPSSCTPRTHANPWHSSSTLPGTHSTHRHYWRSPVYCPCPASVSYALHPSRCSASVYTV
ncbi:hypothetical protein C0993_001359, partial [Termitomyces sp. T159_Od127]